LCLSLLNVQDLQSHTVTHICFGLYSPLTVHYERKLVLRLKTEPAFHIKIKLCIIQQQFHIKTCGDIQNKMCALHWTSVMLQGLTNDNTTGRILNNICQLLHKF